MKLGAIYSCGLNHRYPCPQGGKGDLFLGGPGCVYMTKLIKPWAAEGGILERPRAQSDSSGKVRGGGTVGAGRGRGEAVSLRQ